MFSYKNKKDNLFKYKTKIVKFILSFLLNQFKFKFNK